MAYKPKMSNGYLFNIISYASGGWKFNTRLPAWLNFGEDLLPGFRLTTSHRIFT